MIFRNQTQAELWQMHWCEKCFEPAEAQARMSNDGRAGCALKARALKNKTLPDGITRNNKATEAKAAFKCLMFQAKPASTSRPKIKAGSAVNQPAMFEVPEADRNLIPVEGWPDYRAQARRARDGEHQ